jgi:hypothetical protein
VLLEALRDAYRLLSRHRVEHEEHVVGFDSLRTRASSSISSSSTCRRPAVSRITTSRRRPAARRARRGRPHRIARSSRRRDLDLPPELLELVDRGRALEVGGDERRLLALLAQEQRELRGGGRLARPWRPASRITVGGFAAKRAASRRAHQRGQLVVDDLHDLLAGRQALETSWPVARSGRAP